jgi:alpha-amylase
VGKSKCYWDEEKNKVIFERVVRKSYLPTNNLLLKLMKETDNAFKASFSISGVTLEQLRDHPNALESFSKLVDRGCEILDETYYHSLAFLYSKREFKEQVKLHRKAVWELFGVRPKVFRNTELIYSNEIAEHVEKMRYKGILGEGTEKILGHNSPCFVYKAKNCKLRVLLRHYRLSDDISFRFSLHTWKEFPLTADKYATWINACNLKGEIVNLFMDYETFGEHQWRETGIFEFLKHFPKEVLKRKDEFVTPSEAIKRFEPKDELDVPFIVSWADTERDLTAWLGNKMQQYAIKKLYELEEKILVLKDKKLIEDWRKLQISDHFYFMCTKWFADGDVHKYFNPYDSPYDAFINFMNVLEDLKQRIEAHERRKLTREKALKFLANVEEGKEFYCKDGKVFRNLRDLYEGLKIMNSEIFSFHVNDEKNDFVNWIRACIGDEVLAEKLEELREKETIIKILSERIRELKKLI